MRVVALLVVLCGCRVAASSPGADAASVLGDGLPERIVTDSPLWADVRELDGANDRVVVADRATDGADRSGDATGGAGDGPGEAAPGDTCALLGAACVGREGCYPFPFESASPSDARCAFQGVGGQSVPCQSQLECDATTVCAAPGQPDSVCLLRCSLTNPRCPTGQACAAYFGYTGVGVCR